MHVVIAGPQAYHWAFARALTGGVERAGRCLGVDDHRGAVVVRAVGMEVGET